MNKAARLLASYLLVVLLSAASLAQEPAVLEVDRQIVATEPGTSKLLGNLEVLCDTIGPRVTGSPGLRKANEWVAARMREYGLENVHQEDHTIPVAWERGRIDFRLLSPRPAELSAAAAGWTPPTRGTVRGPVVIYDPKDDADRKARYDGKLRSAVVLMRPPAQVPQIISVRGTAQIGEELEIERLQAEAAPYLAEQGVAAILRDAGKPHCLLSMAGSWAGLDERGASKAARITTLFASHETYSLLYRLARRGEVPRVQLRVDARFVRGPVTVSNTVGEIRGSEKPDEVVICGAHLDSWDLGEGTVDDGTGSMIVLEAARLLKAVGARPKRTIRFIFFYGEEQGLIGSAAYAERHKDELSKVSAVFVSDTGTGRINGIGLHGSPHLRPVFEGQWPILKELGVTNYNAFPMGGTDHASFFRYGVPSCWYTHDGGDYGLMHHSQSDTFDKALPDALTQCASVMAVCAYNTAQLPDLLPRKAAPSE